MENGPSFLVQPVKFITTILKRKKPNGTNLTNGTGSKVKSMIHPNYIVYTFFS
jgi:hypothetical protein